MIPLGLLSRMRWSFPQGPHHQLLTAAIGGDDEAGLAAAHAWLSEHDLDAATFRDQRLLLSIAARFGTALRRHAAWPRLVGLQRLLWTRSTMALQQARRPLARIVDSGHPLLVIKGAARLVAQPDAGRQRVAWDLDVVVRPECMTPAFDLLTDDGWLPSPGCSSQYLRERLPTMRSINMYKHDFGDIDLHRRPFHPDQGGAAEDDRLWRSSRAATLSGVAVQLPQPEDRIALSIGHGGLDGHSHSDWMVDCAVALRSETIDWNLLGEILLSRRIATSAAITFLYFQERLGLAIPAEFVGRLADAARRAPLEQVLAMVQMRPKDHSGTVGKAARFFAKMRRRRLERRQTIAAPHDLTLRVERLPSPATDGSGRFATVHSLTPDARACDKPSLEVDIVVDVQPTGCRRRVELEINTPDAHVCRIRFRNWSRAKTPQRFRLSGAIPTPREPSAMMLVSRPNRQLRKLATREQRDRYDSLQLRLVRCRLS